ncbi:hypothetical protein A0O30_17235 [Pseudomonas sp. LLC-1]|uniref:hypothetical protein n=1 Tax=Pseudomonas sp. LLC-1 TaxID=1812180 RepID=UPI000D021F8E|nr:hypothetical protein [Pseudomonas sp. LLC-1]PRN03574.1 hypothetical protein A0O30_17235 [Pseudomonas sp. LLC-1]
MDHPELRRQTTINSYHQSLGAIHMKSFPKDEQAKKICWEWAEDFKAVGMMEDCFFWLSIGVAFENGTSVRDLCIIKKINRTIRIKIELAQVGGILPKRLDKALVQIRHEAKYLEMLMTHTFG